MESKDKKKELTEKQKALVVALFGEAKGNWRDAMRIAGYSDMTSVSEAIEPIKEEIISQSNSFLASMTPKALLKMAGLLDEPNTPGAPTLKSVAESVLNRVGLHEKRAGDEVLMKVPSGGLFILPAKEVQVFTKVIPDEVNEIEEESPNGHI